MSLSVLGFFVGPVDTPAGAVLTMAFPLAVFAAVCVWGFFERKRIR